jgi:hypothetical protein
MKGRYKMKSLAIGTKVKLGGKYTTRFQHNVEINGTIVSKSRAGRYGMYYEIKTDKFSIMHFGEYTRTICMYRHEFDILPAADPGPDYKNCPYNDNMVCDVAIKSCKGCSTKNKTEKPYGTDIAPDGYETRFYQPPVQGTSNQYIKHITQQQEAI